MTQRGRSDSVPVSWFIGAIGSVVLFWLALVGLLPRAVRWAWKGWRR